MPRIEDHAVAKGSFGSKIACQIGLQQRLSLRAKQPLGREKSRSRAGGPETAPKLTF